MHQYSEVPDHGPALEQMWTDGRHEWREFSGRSGISTAAGTGHAPLVGAGELPHV